MFITNPNRKRANQDLIQPTLSTGIRLPAITNAVKIDRTLPNIVDKVFIWDSEALLGNDGSYGVSLGDVRQYRVMDVRIDGWRVQCHFRQGRFSLPQRGNMRQPS